MKLQVNANDAMVQKLDFYADKMSVSRSALCGMLIGQGLMALDRSNDIANEMGVTAKQMFAGMFDKLEQN